MPKTVPHAPGLEPGDLPFSKVVEANGLVFVAGQVGDVPGGHGAVPGGDRARDPGDARQRRPRAPGGRVLTTLTSSGARSTCATSATSLR